MNTTNYKDTFIEVAEDCPAMTAEEPVKKKGEDTIATIQFQMIKSNPYKYTSDDVIFHCYTVKNKIDEKENERAIFFSKGQPCMRSSPLAKRYGWGVHSNEEGKIAIYPVESDNYKKYQNDENIKHLKAMRSKKA